MLFRSRLVASEILTGEEVVSKGKCSVWARKKEVKSEKDVIYIKLKLFYEGEKIKQIVYTNFYLEDSDGYFNKAMPPDDYIEKNISKGEYVEGGLLFSLYHDIKPCRLWFDTNVSYENSKDSILIDVALPLPSSETRTQFFAQEEIVDRKSVV